MRRALMLFSVGAVFGVLVDRLVRELAKPAAEQFPGLRRLMNDRVNPWLLERGYPGSEHAEIGTLEHVGRASGVRYFTPVHPTVRGETVLVPAPLGDGSQWARNAVQAGRARLQLHDELLDLDRPELIPVAESGCFPAAVAAPFDRMGWRYVRFHVAGRAPGSLAAPAPGEARVADTLPADPPGERPVEQPAAPAGIEPVGAG